jgi:hypothetical protein
MLPASARRKLGDASTSAKDGVRQVSRAAGDRLPEVLKDRASIVVEQALVPALNAAVKLVEFASEATAQMLDAGTVLEFHTSRGRHADSLEDLRRLNLRELDEFSKHSRMKWTSVGVLEGGALGLLATIPYAGGAAAIGADALVVNALTTAIATQSCFAYGYDPEDPRYRVIVERLVRREFFGQASKAGLLREVNSAAFAARGRVQWSAKLRQDERLLAAIEKLGKSFTGRHVPVGSAAKGVPVVAVVVGAGVNARVLGNTAAQARRYLQTLWLAEKYGLELPAGLSR